MSEQLTFDLTTRPALERGDFFHRHYAIALALAMIEDCEKLAAKETSACRAERDRGKRIWPMVSGQSTRHPRHCSGHGHNRTNRVEEDAQHRIW